MIICPNPNCQTPNEEGRQACQACQSALPHYYLWGVGDGTAKLKPGDVLQQRYVLKCDRIFLDRQPGLPPESLPEIPAAMMPYLHLSTYPMQVPRPYALSQGPNRRPVVLLESSALDMSSRNDVPTVLPALADAWSKAPALRQLGWLHQIAQMWSAFVTENVAATLLTPDLIRVDGSIVRLLSLRLHTPISELDTLGGSQAAASAPPTLMALARSWRPLAKKAAQPVREFLGRLCDALEDQQLNAEQLAEKLGWALSVCGQDQQVVYDLAVYTDQGPTRKRNEDACYPASGTVRSLSSTDAKSDPQLLIVCDGIGGHQGGDVASKLAISTITQQLEPVLASTPGELNSIELMLAIEEAICAANDEISAQNDQAQRQARDRMGTTLVLALVKGADVYIAHLGDSRAYRISQTNCQQVTVDDDVASRQVRLGGSLYREVLTQPGAGSLIQALGMGPSQSLRPTVQRFVMDDDCVFLLCSDGLSDSDRVEQFWPYVLKPMLAAPAKQKGRQKSDDKVSASSVGQRLVDIANKYNGHDNVTVGLLSVKVSAPSQRMVPWSAGGSRSNAAPARTAARGGTQIVSPMQPGPRSSAGPNSQASSTRSTAATQTMTPPAKTARPGKVRTGQSSASDAGLLKLAGLAALLFVLAGAGAYFMLGDRFGFFSRDRSEGSAVPPVEGDSDVTSTVTDAAPYEIQEGLYLRLRSPRTGGAPAAVSSEGETREGGRIPSEVNFSGLEVYTNEAYANLNPQQKPTGGFLEGSLVKILSVETRNEVKWVEIQFCAPPQTYAGNAEGLAETNPNVPIPLAEGSAGWAKQSDLLRYARPMDVPLEQRGVCEG